MTTLGEIVVLVYRDALGAGLKIASALSSSTFERSVLHRSLSLDSYGAAGVQIPLEIWNFCRESTTLISFVILTEENPQEVNTCVAYELLKFVTTNAPAKAPGFTVFVPAGSVFPNKLQNSNTFRQAQSLVLNDDVGSRIEMFNELANVAGNLQFKDEFLACLVHFLRVTRLPAILLLVPFYRLNAVDKREIDREKKTVLEAIRHLGYLLAQWLGLNFSNEKLDMNLPDSCLTRPLPKQDHHWSGLYS